MMEIRGVNVKTGHQPMNTKKEWGDSRTERRRKIRRVGKKKVIKDKRKRGK